MKKAFTLIELIAVIILLGIITLIVYPNVNDAVADSKHRALEQTIDNLKHVAYTYTVENVFEQDLVEKPIQISKFIDI